ncbi:hypothetical protein HK107_13785 [Parvularcula sp. ZS-1/3]|uniref:EF-hand domain-containing protein n=1 Tax=Parvularcula mediterranea TaxID=2732508 RepID=A0A7Y3RNM6_9PROT|nr:hemopexin repeat-containing protein [Parvularcula mediterranea]NNU17398.1 hypothetical protein [Parvularcula mediterranea]
MRNIITAALAVLLLTAGSALGQELKSFGYGTMWNSPLTASRPTVVVFINTIEAQAPRVTAQTRVFTSIPAMIWGPGANNANAYYNHASAGRFQWTRAQNGVYGPYQSQNGHCLRRANGATFSAGRTILRHEAVRFLMSDPNMNMRQFDTNGNGIVSHRELAIHIVYNCPPSTSANPHTPTSGEVREVDVTVRGLRFAGKVSSSKTTVSIPTLHHELAHLLGTYDLYTDRMDCDCRSVSLMHVRNHQMLSDLDGPHKFALGWTRTSVIDIAKLSRRSINEALGRNVHYLIYDSRRSQKEYFYTEFRRSNDPFEAGLFQSGLAVWRVTQRADGKIDRIRLLSPNILALSRVSRAADLGNRVDRLLFEEADGSFTPVWENGEPADFAFRVTDPAANGARRYFAERDIFTAAATLPSTKKGYFFQQEDYFRFDYARDRFDRKRRAGEDGKNWSAYAQHADGAFARAANGETQVYFLRGSRYYRYSLDRDQVDQIGNISTLFRGVPNNIDAAIHHPTNGKTYFFKGNQYYRYDWDDRRVDATRTISDIGWKGVPSDLNAALMHPNGKAYFFKLDRGRMAYHRYDFGQQGVDRTGIMGTDGWLGKSSL